MTWRILLASIAAMTSSVAAIAADGLDKIAGKALFERIWIAAPSSTDASDGLGPLFNARACASCHPAGGSAAIRKANDARSADAGVVIRLGAHDATPDPLYGLQLQTQAIPGMAAEVAVATLRPMIKLDGLTAPLSAMTKMSVRIAPDLHGLGALDDITDAEILSRADPDDQNNDGISGRANRVDGRVRRFGWKAAHPTLKAQTAHAFAIDMGLSSPLQPLPAGDCTRPQRTCLSAPNGESARLDNREISDAMLDLVVAYVATLHIKTAPAANNGARIFSQSGCAACHVPKLKAVNGAQVRAFTDLLLHDMGPELDDGVGELGVVSSEWRTPPLKGLFPKNAVRLYLHDGRASTIHEAIDGHGGEGARSRDKFRRLPSKDRAALIGYLKGL